MKTNWNNKTIIEEIKKNGYYIFPNYFSTKDLKKIKSSLLRILHYIKPDSEQDLQKKYYQIKKFNPKLKGHFYDMVPHDINLLQFLHKPEMINLVKIFFDTDVIFSGRPAIHVHDDENDKLLDPHQETAQFARDTILFWSPLYDSNKEQGGMAIYKDSHKHGYFKHKLEHPRLGNKSWTQNYTHVDPSIADKFERIELQVKAGSAVFMHSAVIHSGYPTTKKDFVRFVITERFNPLKKIPYLQDENAPKKIPYTGVDYNKILD